jgi:hypothetical protein
MQFVIKKTSCKVIVPIRVKKETNHDNLLIFFKENDNIKQYSILMKMIKE